MIRSPLLLNDSLPLLWRFIWFTLTVVILFVFLFIADFLFLDNVFLGLPVRYANPAPSPILVILLYHCKLMTSSWCNYSLILQQRYHILWVSYACHNDLRRSRVIERLMHLGRCGQTTSPWNPRMNSQGRRSFLSYPCLLRLLVWKELLLSDIVWLKVMWDCCLRKLAVSSDCSSALGLLRLYQQNVVPRLLYTSRLLLLREELALCAWGGNHLALWGVAVLSRCRFFIDGSKWWRHWMVFDHRVVWLLVHVLTSLIVMVLSLLLCSTLGRVIWGPRYKLEYIVTVGWGTSHQLLVLSSSIYRWGLAHLYDLALGTGLFDCCARNATWLASRRIAFNRLVQEALRGCLIEVVAAAFLGWEELITLFRLNRLLLLLRWNRSVKGKTCCYTGYLLMRLPDGLMRQITFS